MSSPSCIVESGKLSPVGQRNLALFQAQGAKSILVVLMSEAHIKGGFYGPDPSDQQPTAWMLPFRQAGIPVGVSIKGLRSNTKAVIVLSAADWAARKQFGVYKEGVFQVWGEGGEAKSWPVMPLDAPPVPGAPAGAAR